MYCAITEWSDQQNNILYNWSYDHICHLRSSFLLIIKFIYVKFSCILLEPYKGETILLMIYSSVKLNQIAFFIYSFLLFKCIELHNNNLGWVWEECNAISGVAKETILIKARNISERKKYTFKIKFTQFYLQLPHTSVEN